MRSTADRIRHAVCFEIIGVLLVTPLAGWVFSAPLQQVGVLAVAMSIIATLWNYIYNILFDRLMLRLRGRVRRNPVERIVHAVVFEPGMLCLSLPPLMWWMNYGLLRALQMDIGLMVFYLLYTHVYNWLYDIVFPLPDTGATTSHG